MDNIELTLYFLYENKDNRKVQQSTVIFVMKNIILELLEQRRVHFNHRFVASVVLSFVQKNLALNVFLYWSKVEDSLSALFVHAIVVYVQLQLFHICV